MSGSDEMRVHHGTMTYFNNMLEDVCMGHPEAMKLAGAHMSAPAPHVFGRLFPAAPPPADVDVYIEKLVQLAELMKETGSQAELGNAPAGFAFFGQFIDHDLTLDATTELGKVAGDPSKIENFRTPRFDLDSVYGSGPEVSPHLYGQKGAEAFTLLLGTDSNPHDLQRNRVGRAIMGDPRNDENLIVSQIHGNEFIALHNKELVKARSGTEATLEEFREAQEAVRKEYRRRIVEEFLPAVVTADVLTPLLDDFQNGTLPNKPINWNLAPDMPVEFSAAAFRFGHSMIPNELQINKNKTVGLFKIGGFAPVAVENNVNLDLFFNWNPSVTPQMARKIDTKLVKALLELPEEIVGMTGEKNLAVRNMVRGQITYSIPSGDWIANEYFSGAINTHPFIEEVGLEGNTPLWFYILAEAELCGGKLGPVGGTLVAGTILNLMLRAP